MVEIATVDNEKDFILMTRDEYINRYGNERYKDWEKIKLCCNVYWSGIDVKFK